MAEKDLQRAWELSVEMVPLRAAVDGDRAWRERAADRRRSNSQIGKDLIISPKTVSVHVSNVLRKIGVADRGQAAAWAERVGLVQGAKSRGA